MKRRILSLFVILASLFTFSSCLERDFEDLPTYDEAEILNFYFEYRYIDATNRLSVTKLNGTHTVDKEAATVTCNIVVPKVSATLPQNEWDNVSLATVAGYCQISEAAIIKPVDGAPVLGNAKADWGSVGSEHKYLITAGDGTTKEWTVIINSFTK